MTHAKRERRSRASPPRPVLLGTDDSTDGRGKKSSKHNYRWNHSDSGSESGSDCASGSGSGSASGSGSRSTNHSASTYHGQRRKFRDYSYKGKSYADIDSSRGGSDSQSQSCKSKSFCPTASDSCSASASVPASVSCPSVSASCPSVSASLACPPSECDSETINSCVSSSSSGNCPVAKSICVQAGPSYQRTLKYQRAKDDCGEPVSHTCKRDTEYVFRVPNGVSTVVVTAIGGGGAGGSRLTGETNNYQVSNGAGGQAGSSFINVPIDVTPGDELIFSVGAGGNPPSRQQINVSDSTQSGNFAPSIVDRTYAGVLEKSGCADNCKYRDQLLTLAGGQGAVLDDTQGAPTVIRLRDSCGVETIKVIADGGLSGNQVVNPVFDPYLRTGRYNAGNTNFGAPGDVISSGSGAGLPPSPDYPTAYGALPSQGGSSPFGPGGNAMVTPANGFFEQTVTGGVPIFSYFPINQQACPDGVLGSGGAGATIRFPAGRGGDGFVTFSFTTDC